MRDLSKIVTSWEIATELGRTWRQAGDEARFELGDLACFVCNRKNGRPLAGAEDQTLSAFAHAIGEHRPAVSQMAALSEFLPDDTERQTCFEMGVGWHSLNAARIRTGWKPGEPVTKTQREFFWSIVTKEADGGEAHQTPTPTDDARRALQQCDRMSDTLGRLLKLPGLPNMAYAFMDTAQEDLIAAAASLERHIEKLGVAPVLQLQCSDCGRRECEPCDVGDVCGCGGVFALKGEKVAA